MITKHQQLQAALSKQSTWLAPWVNPLLAKDPGMRFNVLDPYMTPDRSNVNETYEAVMTPDWEQRMGRAPAAPVATDGSGAPRTFWESMKTFPGVYVGPDGPLGKTIDMANFMSNQVAEPILSAGLGGLVMATGEKLRNPSNSFREIWGNYSRAARDPQNAQGREAWWNSTLGKADDEHAMSRMLNSITLPVRSLATNFGRMYDLYKQRNP